jgi:hypothetical protein
VTNSIVNKPNIVEESPFSKYEDIPRTHDIDPIRRFPSIGYMRWRYRRLLDRAVRQGALPYWEEHKLIDGGKAHHWIHDRIVKAVPTAVGRVGGVEASIGLWANSIPMKAYPFGSVQTAYWETNLGATNAGIRPRNKASYQAFGQLLLDSIQHLDVMGVWQTPYEPALLQRIKTTPLLVNIELLSPSFEFNPQWMDALDGKTVLVVSPYIDSYEKQLGRLRKVWPAREKVPNFTMKGIKFPYLIEDDCRLTWWGVYGDIAKVVRAGQYDVALLGCGGLGLPLAVMARLAGKIGLHLGGHLQLMFGVYGNRFLEQEWHKRWINEAWVRPESHEVPQSASRVEGGCYW